MAESIFLKKMRDVYRLCEKYHLPRFSSFLDETEQAELKKFGIGDGVLFGGYDGAERCMLGVFPDWQEPCGEEFPIRVIKITKKYERELTHRNYLGTIMSLGIERAKIGDILVGERDTYVFAAAEVAEFISENLKKVGGCGVSACICDFSQVELPDKKFELFDIVAAGLRLDAVLAGMLKVSRSVAKAQIAAGKVSVNHIEAQRADYTLSAGDILSVRGFGRCEIFEIGNKTRSDRLHIILKKYI